MQAWVNVYRATCHGPTTLTTEDMILIYFIQNSSAIYWHRVDIQSDVCPSPSGWLLSSQSLCTIWYIVFPAISWPFPWSNPVNNTQKLKNWVNSIRRRRRDTCWHLISAIVMRCQDMFMAENCFSYKCAYTAIGATRLIYWSLFCLLNKWYKCENRHPVYSQGMQQGSGSVDILH